MSVNSAKFAELLTKAVRQIHVRENKPLSIIQDELGQAVGKSGSSAIEHWRKGNIPKSPTMRQLAEQIARRDGLSPIETQSFLVCGGMSRTEAQALCEEWFDGQTSSPVAPKPLAQSQSNPNEPTYSDTVDQTEKQTKRGKPISLKIIAVSAAVTTALLTAGAYRQLSNASPLRDGAMKLVKSGDRYVVVTHNGQPLEPGATIRVHESISVSFRLMNVDTQTIMLEKIVIGARGPGANCALEAQKWDASNGVPFNARQSQTLMPGEIYEYRDTRSFFEPGLYFIEPLIEDSSGKWHGVSPFTCLDVIVE
jgi:hypothetical protein